ncbi:MAG: hypothetical protein ABI857_03200 [Acidobacteriota bacterium]
MNKIRQNMLKVLVMVGLFCTSAFAEGDMGGGGLADTGIDSKTSKTVITRTTEDGDMGGGGLAESSYFDTVIASIYGFWLDD